MNVLRGIGIALGAIVMLAVVFALSAPKAVNALVATLVRNIDNPGRATLVTESCDAASSVNSNGDISCSPSYAVPAGARLVIQHVDEVCTTPKGNSMVFPSISLTSGGVSLAHTFVLTNEGTNPATFGSGDVFVGNQAGPFYADPNSTFRFDTSEYDTTGNTGCHFQISGYLISYP